MRRRGGREGGRRASVCMHRAMKIIARPEQPVLIAVELMRFMHGATPPFLSPLMYYVCPSRHPKRGCVSRLAPLPIVGAKPDLRGAPAAAGPGPAHFLHILKVTRVMSTLLIQTHVRIRVRLRSLQGRVIHPCRHHRAAPSAVLRGPGTPRGSMHHRWWPPCWCFNCALVNFESQRSRIVSPSVVRSVRPSASRPSFAFGTRRPRPPARDRIKSLS